MKFLFFTLVLVLLAVSAFADNTVRFGGVFYYNGILTAPDSINMSINLQPSDLDTTFTVLPDSAIWDSTVTLTGTDVTALVEYWVYFGPNGYVFEENQELRLDSTNFTGDYFTQSGTASKTAIEATGSVLWGLSIFWSSCDSCLMIYWPRDGTSPKDSVQIFTAGGSLAMTIKYIHSNVNTVMDSTLVIHRLP